MCLKIIKTAKKDLKDFIAGRKTITVYKIVKPDMKSYFREFQWKVGVNKSGREYPLTPAEQIAREVNEGFHFSTEKPEECRYQYQCQYRYPYPCRYQYPYLCQYRCQYKHNIVLKCQVEAGDVVAVGEWEGIPSLVATKCIVEEE